MASSSCSKSGTGEERELRKTPRKKNGGYMVRMLLGTNRHQRSVLPVLEWAEWNFHMCEQSVGVYSCTASRSRYTNISHPGTEQYAGCSQAQATFHEDEPESGHHKP
ncbi:unnamed protein product [Ectocarpus sp. 8 AP-2014]